MIRKTASYLCSVFSVLCIVLSIAFITPQASAQSSCQTPAAVTGVNITYPDCSATSCNFNQGTCSWSSATNAATYTVLVTNTATGAQAYSQSVPAATTTVAFPVTNGQTYKCDVTGVNSCGQAGTLGTQTLLCEVEGASVPATPTPIPVVNQPPPVQLPPTGIVSTSIMIAGASILFLAFGGYALKKH